MTPATRIGLGTILTLTTMTAMLVPAPAAAQPPGPPGEGRRMEERRVPTITVGGSGEVRVEPDEGIVRLGVQAQDKTAMGAQINVNLVANAILTGVKKLGIPAEAVQTSQLTLSPVYSSPPPRSDEPHEPKIIGYQAANVVSVTVADLAKIGPVLDAALLAGANRVDGVDFRVRDDRAAREKALRLAAEDGQRKARALAESLGVKLGDLLDVQEGGVNVIQPVMEMGFARMAMADSSTPVSAGQTTISANVTLRYRIGG